MPIRKVLYIGNKLENQNRTPTAADIIPDLLENEGFPVYSYSSKQNKFLRLFEMLWKTYKLSSEVDSVIIDVYSTQNFWYAYLCGNICRLRKVPYINVLHGGKLENRLNKRYLSFFEDAKFNIAPSQFLMAKFSSSGLNNLKFIPNSILLKNYKFKERMDFKPKLLWVRAFADIYNPILAIKLLQNLLQDYKDAELFMVGPKKDNSYDECLAYAYKHNLPVHFTGKLDKQEWHQLSQNCDFFINTSRIDNTPVSIVEAMALGLPVISTNTGGIPYLINDGIDGILYENDDLDHLNFKMMDLLKNPLHSKNISLAAREKVQSFDWEIVKKLWLNILS